MRKNMYLHIIVIIGILTVGIYSFASSYYKAYHTNYMLKIDDKVINTKKPIVSIDNSAYISIREFCEIIGYDIEWLENKKTIDIKSNNSILERCEEVMAAQLIKERIGIELPQSNQIIKFDYNQNEDYFDVKFSIDTRDKNSLINQLNKLYKEAEQDDIKNIPNFNNTCEWWDLDIDTIDTVYHDFLPGVPTPECPIPVKTHDMWIFITREINNRNIIYISY